MMKKAAPPPPQPSKYKLDLDARQEKRMEGRNIAHLIHPPRHPRRKEKCKKSLVEFCRTYFSHVFNLPFSQAHIDTLNAIQDAITRRVLWPALFLPRGFGKTTMVSASILWAILYGHTSFIVILAANQHRAADILSGIKRDLISNDLLEEDFPEICVPLREIEGSRQRALLQNINGQLTYIQSRADILILPFVLNANKKPIPGAGTIIRAAGLGTAIRGLRYTRPDSTVVRPDLIICDDPQTDEVASSPSQINSLMESFQKTLAGLGGPSSSPVMIVTATIIRPDDLADRIYKRIVSSQFHPIRYRFLEGFKPSPLIEDYKNLRKTALSSGDIESVNSWWREHQSELEQGITPLWEHYRRPSDVSAIQTAINVYCDSPAAFYCELQNDPDAYVGDTSPVERIRLDSLTRIIIPAPRGAPSDNHPIITAHIDIHETVLYYVVISCNEASFRIIDYGTHPENPPVFDHSNPKVSITQIYGPPPKGIAQAVAELIRRLKLSEYSGRIINRVTIDAAWGALTSYIRQICALQEFRGYVIPAFGIVRKINQTSMNEWKVRPGEMAGPGWRFGHDQNGLRFAYDTNYHKTMVVRAILDSRAEIFEGDHYLLFQHFMAETPIIEQSAGRQQLSWYCSASTANHYWDCVVGAFAFSRTHFKIITQDTLRSPDKYTIEKTRQAEAPPFLPQSSLKTTAPKKKTRVFKLF